MGFLWKIKVSPNSLNMALLFPNVDPIMAGEATTMLPLSAGVRCIRRVRCTLCHHTQESHVGSVKCCFSFSPKKYLLKKKHSRTTRLSTLSYSLPLSLANAGAHRHQVISSIPRERVVCVYTKSSFHLDSLRFASLRVSGAMNNCNKNCTLFLWDLAHWFLEQLRAPQNYALGICFQAQTSTHGPLFPLVNDCFD